MNQIAAKITAIKAMTPTTMPAIAPEDRPAEDLEVVEFVVEELAAEVVDADDDVLDEEPVDDDEDAVVLLDAVALPESELDLSRSWGSGA